MTEETKPDQGKKLVKKEGFKPCGCHVVEFADDTATVTPCPPCGLMECARALGGAAQALAATAARIRQDQNQAQLAAAAARAVSGGGT